VKLALVQVAPRYVRPSILSQEKFDDVSDRLLQSPKKKSFRKLPHLTGLMYSWTHKAVKNELKLFPYKVSAVQQLKDADYQKRLNYCRWFTDIITQNDEA
jgi:hypothetical protein